MAFDSKAYYRRRRDHLVAAARQRRVGIVAKVQALKLSSGCVDCGYKAHPDALDFDHLPGFHKTKPVADAKYRAWDKVLAEMAKCEVVCANCHRIRTANRRAQTQQPLPLIPIPATGTMYQES